MPLIFSFLFLIVRLLIYCNLIGLVKLYTLLKPDQDVA